MRRHGFICVSSTTPGRIFSDVQFSTPALASSPSNPSQHTSGSAGGDDSGMGSGMGGGGGGTGGGRYTSAGDADDHSHWQFLDGIQKSEGLALIRLAIENEEAFKTSVTTGINSVEFLQQLADDWVEQHPEGATVLFMDGSALPFQGGAGGSVGDAVRQVLQRTVGGIKNAIAVVSPGPASVPSGCILKGRIAVAVSLLHATAACQGLKLQTQ